MSQWIALSFWPPMVGEALPEREVDRPVDLLVPPHVLDVPRDAAVAADAELSDPPGAVVRIQHGDEVALAPARGRVDDATALEPQPDPLESSAEVRRRILPERDHTLSRVLERTEEELAAGHVQVPVVDVGSAPGDREREVGVGPDDVHLFRRVEPVGERFIRSPSASQSRRQAS